MILSYHPCFVGDENRLCAGRRPDASDRNIMQTADAIILPQGCFQPLFRMAAAECPHVFPNYTARFNWPGKIGQIGLFEQFDMPHPESFRFENLEAYYRAHGETDAPPFGYPFVFKFDWSGEGVNVRRIDDNRMFREALKKADRCERTGQSGFLLQRLVETNNRSLRVAVIGELTISYWRIQPDPNRFGTGLAQGAEIDHEADSGLQAAACDYVQRLCRLTGINLAGFDLIFDTRKKDITPLFLEINYYFGRRGLGGSDRFYELLCGQVEKWLSGLNLK